MSTPGAYRSPRESPEPDRGADLPPNADAAVSAELAAAVGDRYLIRRRIGHGGMAYVFLARDTKHDSDVAIKVLRPEYAQSLGADRFLREIRITAGLVHPHILPLLDSGRGRGLLYYVTPFVEGESLRARLLRERQLGIDDAVRLTTEIATALDCAHRRGVVHRDIKPENILVAEGQAVICDFGIAHAAVVAGDGPITQTGIAVGTPTYMSPEQVAADHSIDGRSDIYSLGCVLYEMLAGEPPFSGRKAESMARQHLLAPAPSVAVMRGSAPPPVVAAIAKALAKAPADRFQTMAEFARALNAPRDSTMAAAAATVAAAARSVKTGARRWLIVAAVAIMLVAAAAGFLSGPPPSAGIEAPVLSPMRVAVFPFAVHADSGSEFLGEAAMDLLSGAIDGVGEIKRVFPRALMNRLRQQPEGDGPADIDPAGAGKVSAEFGAGRFVLGAATAVGHRLHLEASLYEVGKVGEPVATASRQGAVEDLSAMVTEIARELFARQPVGGGARLTSIAAVSAANHVAERAYLEGEAMIRRGSYDSAVVALTRAVAADSSFALAWYRLAYANDFGTQTEPRDMMASIDAAMRHRDLLTPRDRMLVEAHHALTHGDGALAERRALAVVDAFPDEVEGWWLLGVSRSWHSWQRGRAPTDAVKALERALIVDPDHRPALHNLSWISMQARNYAAAETLVARAYSLNSMPEVRVGVDAVLAVVRRDSATLSRIISQIARGNKFVPRAVAQVMALHTDDLEAAGRVARITTDSVIGAGTTRAYGNLTIALLELARGRSETARREFALVAVDDRELALTYRAWFAALPIFQTSREELAALRDTLARWQPKPGTPPRDPAWMGMPENTYPHVRTYLLGLIAARLGDGAAALRHAEELDRVDPRADSAGLFPDLALEVRALVAIHDGRNADGLRHLEGARLMIRSHYGVSSPLHMRSFGRFLLAELLRDAGRDREALGWYSTLGSFIGPEIVFLAPAYLGAARIHDDNGNEAGAIDYYTRFIARWKDSDSELRPQIVHAREALARLSGERVSASSPHK